MTSTALLFFFESANTKDSTFSSTVFLTISQHTLLTIKIVMPYMHIIDSFVTETRCHGHIIFFHFKNEGQESFDVGRRDIVAV